MRRLVVDVSQGGGLIEALTLRESGGELLAMGLLLVYTVVLPRRTLLPSNRRRAAMTGGRPPTPGRQTHRR